MADAPVKFRPGNLPAELTSFVGRRKELSEVKRLLTATRLLTLTGSGGAGKTRLALRVAAELTRNFPDGV
jgi:MoxR-like ATPase